MPRNPLYDVIEPCPITDEVIAGCAKVEQLGDGLVRVWLYAEETFVEPLKVIRAKLIMPADVAREIATKITAEVSAPEVEK